MKKINNLVKFELVKLTKDGAGMIAFAFVMTLSAVLFALIIQKYTYGFNIPDYHYLDIRLYSSHWYQDLEVTLQKILNAISDPSTPTNIVNELKVELALVQYYLQYRIMPIYSNQASNFLISYNRILLVIVMTVVVVAMSSFDFGTIREDFIYSLPIKRHKVLTSKFITIAIFAVCTCVFAFVVSIILGWIFFGWDSYLHPFVYYNNGSVRSMPLLLYSILQIGMNVFCIMFFVLIAFLIVLLTKRALVAIFITGAIYGGGHFLGFAVKNVYFARFLPFINQNLFYHYDASYRIPEGVTPLFSFLVMIGWIVLLGALCYAINNKRDIRD